MEGFYEICGFYSRLSNTGSFFLHPANVREMRSVLKQNRFDYPVCMDTEDTFNKVNKFPSQLNFQTFY